MTKAIAKTSRMPCIRDQDLIEAAEVYVRTKSAARDHRKAKEDLRKHFLPLLDQGHHVARLGAFRVLMKKVPTTVYDVPTEVKKIYQCEGYRRTVDVEPIPVQTVEDREDRRP